VRHSQSLNQVTGGKLNIQVPIRRRHRDQRSGGT
jgi:hypothetical protein